MTDATTHGHPHGHPHGHEHADAHGPGAPGVVPASLAAPRLSLIEASAGGRLSLILLMLAALWAGVYWALH